jgi:phosphoribosylformylglycinamidine cyclo-ligase
MRAGKVALGEMRRVFNLGVGLIAIVDRADVDEVRGAASRVGVATWLIGEIRAGMTGVRWSTR